ncbi:MAG: glycosyltransferase [Chloroflexi bacterium]|nr:glycosyltransferase [Chloroflexota bacterium]
MRILFLTQVLPFPADSGPKIKTFNVLRHLARKHTLHLVSFVRSEAEERDAEALKEWCETVDTVRIQRSTLRDVASLLTSWGSGRPFLVERDDSDIFRCRVQQLLYLHNIDAVHADQLTMGQFAVDLPVRVRVLDEHNAVWTIVKRVARHEPWGARRLVAELEWRRVRSYEGALCRAFDGVLVVSDGDLRDLEAAANASIRATVVPIAVDTDTFAFKPRTDRARHIVSMATMFYPPNAEGVAWFARDVYPLVRQELRDSTFYVVGSKPPEHIRELATAQPGIEVTGYVPDLNPYLDKSAVLVVPLHSGSGMRVKILEAFARGVPVVSTTIGVEGIEARHGEHLLVADTPEAFAQAVVRTVSQPDEARERAQAARRLVEDRYDMQTALGKLDDLYQDELGQARASRPVDITCGSAG